MDQEQITDFKMWFRAQPGYTSYTRVKNFLSDFLGTSNSKAEVQMAKLQTEGEIKIIEKKSSKSGGRRVFLAPLPELTEQDIRNVYNTSSNVEKDATRIALKVHDQTGHSVQDIKMFMENLDNAYIAGGSFSWK